MLVAALISFILGFVGMVAGLLWLQHALDGGRFWSWELIIGAPHTVLLGVFGGLGLCATVCGVLNWWHFRKGCFRCPYCGCPLPGIGKSCSCPQAQALSHQAGAARG
jgi:hypothetical protein